MSFALTLTRRNLTIFFRDRAGVFFSILSALILIALYAFFLGNLQVKNLQEHFPHASTQDITWFVDSWVFAGITMITTLTASLSALSILVEDKSTDRFKDFLVSPASKADLILGYLLSSFAVAVIISSLVAVVGELFLLSQGYPTVSFGEALQILFYIALSSAAFSALASFLVTFLKSSGAFAALSAVIGTLVGFLAGAYIPPGTLPLNVMSVVNALPFAQSAMLIRQPFTAQATEKLIQGPGSEQAGEALRDFYGITANVADFQLTDSLAITILLITSVTFFVFGTYRIRRSIL
ncbi:ABC transporter permease [Aurantimicrobium minutum]|uniref:ABC transporter permease n=1 Tax=Aurantimicrobium minutum TaxID=708131 RepID=UPI0024743F1E|nr:ABC transporter permease [Aurantimicrobium minutum]MDH6422293.1 multidrug/hemolysin transport system permease protein [Aurantimicrobium minutum]